MFSLKRLEEVAVPSLWPSDENRRAVSGRPAENTTDSAGVALTSYAINSSANIDVIAAVREI